MPGKYYLNMSTNKTKSKLHFLQNFEVLTIHRSQIKTAPYNPRTISDENKKLLNANLQKKGLLETLVWNKATGNLVSGHRRLEKLDAAYQGRFKSLDYELTVAAVDLTDKEEKEQNIFFNNPNAQGDWDRDLMLEIIPDIDTKAAGLTDDDLCFLGIEVDIQNNNVQDTDDIIANFETIKQEKKAEAKAKGDYPEHLNYRKVKGEIDKKAEETGTVENDEHEDYFVVTFSNWQAKEAFQKRFGFPERDRYVKGEVLVQRINEHLGE